MAISQKCCCKGNCGGMKFRPISQVAIVVCPRDEGGPESLLRGPIRRQYAHGKRNALYVIEPAEFRWSDTKWEPYTGIRFVLARETRGVESLEWVDRWEGAA